MTPRPHPVARTGPRPAGALPLAGSRHVWFDEVLVDGRRIGLTALPPADLHRLSAPRAAICGLTPDRPLVMAILNATPDSFSDGGDLAAVAAALAHARAAQGVADILDIGGESTRPGAADVPAAQEIARVVPVIAAIRDAGLTIPISVDTRKAAVALAALEAGADMVNDVSAMLYDSEMAALVAERQVPVCLMHSQGTPATMQQAPRYGDVLAEVCDHLAGRIAAAEAAGIPRKRIVADPGIGFGKTQEHNLDLLRGIALFHDLGVPVLLGVSRKRFIGSIGKEPEPKRRMPGSLAVALAGAGQAVQILRVHDMVETRQALRLWGALVTEGQEHGT